MAKHKAIVVGCGRIGVGRNWAETPYVYTHAGAYAALRDRVSLEAVVDFDEDALAWAKARWGVAGYSSVEAAMDAVKPDIVSLATNPSQHRPSDINLCFALGAKGVWCEKPYFLAIDFAGKPIQVNYIRRFDQRHIAIQRAGGGAGLWVWGKKDIHTVCHFTDLAIWMGVKKENLRYFPMAGPCSYVLTTPRGVDEFFPMGGVVGGFMEAALGNLLDTVEGRDTLVSPASSAILSERWANEII